MTKRARLKAKIKRNLDKIEALKKLNIELARESFLLCDKQQWYIEKEEERVISRRPKKTETILAGRIHWKEFYHDSDFPNDKSKGFWVERKQIVRINGEWLYGEWQ
jgi:hypothetical protein